MMRNFLLLSLLLSLPALALAEIYSWVDDSGNRVYSDQKPASGEHQSLSADRAAVNYYQPSARSSRQPTASNKAAATVLHAEHSTADDDGEQDSAMSEQQCQQDYGLSCERIANWQHYAREACGDDPRCDDASFLARKYQPVPLAQLRRQAQRIAAKRSRDREAIELFIRQRYSDYCEQRKAQLCRKGGAFGNPASCEQQLAQYCEQDGELEDLLARHPELTPLEKQRYLALADKLQAEQQWEELQQLLQQLLEVALTQAAL